MVAINQNASSTEKYAGNRRVRKTVTSGGLAGNIPNGTTDSCWFGWQTMEERNPFGGSGSTDIPMKQYVWGTYVDECVQINLLVTAGSQSLPTGYYYPLQDTLYRTVALTNSSGAIVEAYDLDAYGNTLILTAADSSGNWWSDSAVQSSYGANEIIYCGYRYDAETDNYYVRNRYYSPVLGRWLTRDPIGYQGGINLYAYAGSSPVGNVDAEGLSWWGWMFQPGTSYGYMGMGGTIRRNPLPPPTPQSGWLGALDNFQAWINGHRGTTYYPPGSPDSRQMSQSTVGEALVRYFLLVKNPGNPPCEKWRGVSDFSGKFGLTDVFENFGNGTAEFVGSARGDASILRVHCSGTSGSVTVKFKLTNVTSLTSFLYHLWPNGWNVTTPGRPFSNWTQIYEWTRTFNCRCCNPRGDIGR